MSVNGTSECATIEIPQDQALEGDHDFTVQFSTFSPDLVTVESEADDSEIIITDDDSMCAIVCRCLYVANLCVSIMLKNAFLHHMLLFLSLPKM